MAMSRLSYFDQFYKYVTPKSKEECWEWEGNTFTKAGHAQLGVGGKRELAHRVSYEIHVEDILPGQVIRHTCDNPPCVNPHHLIAGTVAQNMNDKVLRDRQTKGETNPGVKLTEELVLKIRRDYSRDIFSQRTIAKEYGVAQSLISQIVNKKIWRHI